MKQKMSDLILALFVKITNCHNYYIVLYSNTSKINYLFTHQQLINMTYQEEDESNQQDYVRAHLTIAEPNVCLVHLSWSMVFTKARSRFYRLGSSYL